MSATLSPQEKAVRAVLKASGHDLSAPGMLEYVAQCFVEGMREGSSVKIDDVNNLMLTLLQEAGCWVDGGEAGEVVECIAARGILSEIRSAVEEDAEAVDKGALCLALLEEDGEWHQAVVEDVHVYCSGTGANSVGGGHGTAAPDSSAVAEYTVRFLEYGKPQRVGRSQLVLQSQIPDTLAGGGLGELEACGMCGREMRLTRHHLIPRTTHSRLRKQLGLTTEQLGVSCDICRPCHDMVHRVEDEMSLARHWSSLERLKEHPKLLKWIEYAGKQKVRQKCKPSRGGSNRAA